MEAVIRANEQGHNKIPSQRIFSWMMLEACPLLDALPNELRDYPIKGASQVMCMDKEGKGQPR